MTRLEFAMALGRLAREHGENLLRVKGIVAFADGDGRPAAIHAVQHTMYPPRWLDGLAGRRSHQPPGFHRAGSRAGDDPGPFRARGSGDH